MIEKFKIRNFRSILDLCVDFRYGEKAAPRHFEKSDTWAFLPTRRGKNGRFVPVMAIYGANASGKSNVINAFLTFSRILTQGIAGCFVPNKLNGKYASASFTAEVALEGGRYRYEIEYDGKHILREELCRLAEASDETVESLFHVGKDGMNFSGVASPGYDDERMMQALKIECMNEEGEFIRPFLTCLKRTFPGLSEAAAKTFDEFLQKMQVSNRNEFFISQGVDLLAQFNTPEARELAMAKIVKILRKFDFGVKGMTLNRQKIGKASTPFPPMGLPNMNSAAIMKDAGDAWIVDEIKLVHEDVAGEKKSLDFMTEESDGTKVVAALIGVCLWALETGRMLFVDELDRSLHPFILTSLIRLFKSKRYNKTNAQLIFTAHDATPLEDDLMRVSEVGIIDKTVAKGTTFKRLSDFEDTRNVTNFRKQYLAGAYSGIPFPYI